MNTKTAAEKTFNLAVAAGLFFCFFVFPFFLADFGFSHYFTAKEASQKENAFSKLNNRLELLLRYKNSRRYYHELLDTTLKLAVNSNNPIPYLYKALNNLKQKNKGIFNFALWNDKGELVKPLTDEKGYSYALKTLRKAFIEADKDIKLNYPGHLEEVDFIHDKMSIIKGYLGDFLLPSELNLPYLRLNLGQIITSSANKAKAHFWYKVKNGYVLFAQISDFAVSSDNYLRKLVKSLNKKPENGIVTGIAEVVAKNYIYTGLEGINNDKLLIELKKIQNFSDSRLETENYLILGRIAAKGLLAFCLMPKKGLVIDALKCRQNAQIGMVVFLSVLFLGLLYCKKHTRLFSIRFKLSVLFIYANAFPLLILGIIGYEYTAQTKLRMSLEYQEEIADVLSDFDAAYSGYLSQIESSFNRAVDKINQKSNGEYVDVKNETELKSVLSKYNPLFLISCGGGHKLERAGKSRIKISKLMVKTIENIVDYLNIKDYSCEERFCAPGGDSDTSPIKFFLYSKKIPIQDLLRRLNTLQYEHIGLNKQLYYWSVLGNYALGRFSQMIMAAYSSLEFQTDYIKNRINSVNQNLNGIKTLVHIGKMGLTCPSSFALTPQISHLIAQFENSRVVKSSSIFINNEEYAAYGIAGKRLDEANLIGFKSTRPINKRITNLRILLLCFAVISLFITYMIGRVLAARFLRPVKEIENGVMAIGSRNFSYRLPIESKNEFGQLASAFNRAISGLEDMSIAQVVQESLFPAQGLKKNNLEIFGKSVAMSTLGGDYFDYFELDNAKVGILMGDVAGHGTPAGILMAMAKASVLLSGDEKNSPAAMLARLHDVIYKVKSQNIKRMMTCQYFCVDSLTGECVFANAGHPYPAIVRNNGAETELLELDGRPLGITKKARHTNTAFKLNSNDIMALYTDGIIEAKNANGEAFGFERFKKAVAEAYSTDLKAFYEKLYNTYKSWCEKVDDDLTIVLVRYL